MQDTVNAKIRESSEKSVNFYHIMAFTAMVFGMFMAILDIQIVSASLAEIQAGINASPDEISWIQTSYLIAEVIMIPISGFLTRLMSTRVFFTISAAGFTFASILCATATSIEGMIIARALQGFIGGGMIPSVFAVAFTIFPASKRNIVSSLIGLVATLAPTIGPTIGGYLSQVFSWHWLFLVNLPPGIIISIAAWKLINFDKSDSSLMAKFDWWGLISMATFLGSLEYILEEGPRNGWMDDKLICLFTTLMFVGASVFFWRAFTLKEPIIDLKIFSNLNFAMGSLFSFVMGIGLYGLTYMYPLYLSRIRDYDALMIGKTMLISGFTMFLSAPLAGFLANHIDLRLMIASGFIGFAISTWIVTGLTVEWDFWELFYAQILRGISLMLCMVPINNIALCTLPLSCIKNAASLFNLMRNLGGAVGLTMINTVLMNRVDFHYARIAEAIHWGRAEVCNMMFQLSSRFDLPNVDSHLRVLQFVTNIVSQQATVMAFSDAFLLLTFLFSVLTILVLTIKKPQDVLNSRNFH
ncbi:MAG: MSF transporter [Candidatus Tokpelaia sp. JSC188]|nr:MAG: MSF transporter [Candidatus Tokpelaia sp. JSC188]